MNNYDAFCYFMTNTYNIVQDKNYPRVYKIKEETADFEDYYFELNNEIKSFADKHYEKIKMMYRNIPGCPSAKDLYINLIMYTMNNFHLKGFRSEKTVKNYFISKGWEAEYAGYVLDIVGIDLIIRKDGKEFFVQVKTNDYKMKQEIKAYTAKNVDILVYANNMKFIALSQKAKEFFARK